MNSDRDGFLIPDTSVDRDDLGRGITGIKRDTSDIIKLLKGQTRSTVLQRARVQNPNARARESANPRADAATQAIRQMTRQQAQQAAIGARAEAARRNREGSATPQQREANGRFGAGSRDDSAPGDEGKKDGLFARLKSALSGNSGSAGDVEKVDPAIEAANEMKNMIGGAISGVQAVGELGSAVIGRGSSGGAQDRAVPWYKRMLQQLKLMRRDDSAFQRAELRLLRERQGGGGGSEGPGFFGTLMGTIFGRLGPMVLAGIATLGGALLTGIGTVLGVIFSPVGLAIAAAAALAWGVFTEDGRKFFSTIGARIADGWDVAVKEFSAIWKPLSDFLKDKFGIAFDAVKKTVAPAIAAVKEAAGPALDAAKSGAKAVSDGVGAVVDYGKERVEKMTGAISRLIKAEGTTRVYGMQDGSTEQRDGGSVSWRNNNPGNLKFGYAGSADKTDKSTRSKADALAAAQKRYGAGVIDLDQWGNAIFSSEEAGRAAKAQLLKTSHGNKTIDEMLPKYAVDDYSGKADTKAYANSIYKSGDAKGINLRGKKIRDLSDDEFNTLLDGMKKVEGFKVGSTRAGGGLATNAPLPSIAPTIPALGSSAAMNMPSLAVSVATPPSQTPRADAAIQLNKKSPIEVTVKNDQMAIQDLRDRRLAQIATGGISG